MSKTKETKQQTFEEWMHGLQGMASASELSHVLAALARGDFGAAGCWLAQTEKPACDTSVEGLMRKAYEAGVAANEAVCGIPASRLKWGDLFRKVKGKQVYMMMCTQHINIMDIYNRRIAVNAKGNAIKIERHARVVRCEESEFFPAKNIPYSG